MAARSISSARTWVMVALLAFFGRAIANVPYLREVYYDQVLSALSITNAQLGVLSSAVGIASLFGYFFGGFLSDRVSSKRLVVVSAVAGGVFTLWYATFPPFPVLVAIHAALALAGTLLFWSAYVRILRLLGGEGGQGTYYGTAEGLRGFFGILLPVATTAIMAACLTEAAGLRWALVFYAACYFTCAVACGLVLVDVGEKDACTATSVAFDPREYLALLKMPGLWLVSLLIFGAYTVFALQSYSTPYLTGVCGLPTELVSAIATLRQYGIGLVAMPLFGVLADRVFHSPATACLVGAALLVPCAAGMLVAPVGAPVLIIALVMAIGFLVAGVRGVYYATQDEARIPAHLAGAAAGIISTIGFSPDAFIFSVAGGWLDAYPPEQAYQMIWTYMLVGAVIAAVSAVGILAVSRHSRASAAAPELPTT